MKRLIVLTLLLTLSSGTPSNSIELPTRLPKPEGAFNIHEGNLTDVEAYETYFTMKVAYPANPAIAHYSNVIGAPWVRCEFIPEWLSHLRGNRVVHQQAFMWVNKPARRTLLVASKYYSSAKRAGKPENDDQLVFVVEYFNEDAQEVISSLELKCPGGAAG
jgi:hypothetical protein